MYIYTDNTSLSQVDDNFLFGQLLRTCADSLVFVMWVPFIKPNVFVYVFNAYMYTYMYYYYFIRLRRIPYEYGTLNTCIMIIYRDLKIVKIIPTYCYTSPVQSKIMCNNSWTTSVYNVLMNNENYIIDGIHVRNTGLFLNQLLCTQVVVRFFDFFVFFFQTLFMVLF